MYTRALLLPVLPWPRFPTSIMPELASYSKAALAGRQTMAKFRGDGPAEAVRLYLVNVR